MSNIPMLITETIAAISAAHLTRETFEALEDLCPYPIVFTCPEPEWGVVLRILENDMEDPDEFIPEDLVRLITFAVENHIGYIRLDYDSDPVPGLPVYDW